MSAGLKPIKASVIHESNYFLVQFLLCWIGDTSRGCISFLGLSLLQKLCTVCMITQYTVGGQHAEAETPYNTGAIFLWVTK